MTSNSWNAEGSHPSSLVICQVDPPEDPLDEGMDKSDAAESDATVEAPRCLAVE